MNMMTRAVMLDITEVNTVDTNTSVIKEEYTNLLALVRQEEPNRKWFVKEDKGFLFVYTKWYKQEVGARVYVQDLKDGTLTSHAHDIVTYVRNEFANKTAKKKQTRAMNKAARIEDEYFKVAPQQQMVKVELTIPFETKKKIDCYAKSFGCSTDVFISEAIEFAMRRIKND